MAHPPPKKTVAPTLTPEEQAAKAAADHATAVARLERILDASIAGKTPDATGVLRVMLPLGTLDLDPKVLSDVCDHYTAAGWLHVTTGVAQLVLKDGALVQAVDEHGVALPELRHATIFLVAPTS